MREKLASLQHDIWAHWMKYLFSQCVRETRVSNQGVPVEVVCIIPGYKVDRWQHQTETSYNQLSEKESDRSQADKVLKLMGRSG